MKKNTIYELLKEKKKHHTIIIVREFFLLMAIVVVFVLLSTAMGRGAYAFMCFFVFALINLHRCDPEGKKGRIRNTKISFVNLKHKAEVFIKLNPKLKTQLQPLITRIKKTYQDLCKNEVNYEHYRCSLLPILEGEVNRIIKQ